MCKEIKVVICKNVSEKVMFFYVLKGALRSFGEEILIRGESSTESFTSKRTK